MSLVTKENWQEWMVKGAFQDTWTPLMIAVKYNDVECVKGLISRGYYLDAQNNYGKTALMIAIEQKRTKLIEMLIDAGANLEKRCMLGYTATHYALKGRRNISTKPRKVIMTEFRKTLLNLLDRASCMIAREFTTKYKGDYMKNENGSELILIQGGK